MPALADLKNEINDLTTLKFISAAFTEAAAVKLQNIRVAFEKNGRFYEEISHVYHLVRVSAELLQLKGKKKSAKETKTLSVALTSNQRFYGALNFNIIRTFLEESEKLKTGLLVIGVTGQDYLQLINYAHPYEKLMFAKDFPTAEETRAFLDRTTPYDNVLLYYPKFVTLVTQTVGVTDISQASKPGQTIPEEEIHILFEPEFVKILEFFQRQVRLLLFHRVMLEADLSRTAARLLTMSMAEEHSDEMIKEKKSQYRKVMTSFINAQLLETFSGLTKWKK